MEFKGKRLYNWAGILTHISKKNEIEKKLMMCININKIISYVANFTRLD